LKLCSGTHSGTPNLSLKIISLGFFVAGGKILANFVPKNLLQKFGKFCKMTRN